MQENRVMASPQHRERVRSGFQERVRIRSRMEELVGLIQQLEDRRKKRSFGTVVAATFHRRTRKQQNIDHQHSLYKVEMASLQVQMKDLEENTPTLVENVWVSCEALDGIITSVDNQPLLDPQIDPSVPLLYPWKELALLWVRMEEWEQNTPPLVEKVRASYMQENRVMASPQHREREWSGYQERARIRSRMDPVIPDRPEDMSEPQTLEMSEDDVEEPKTETQEDQPSPKKGRSRGQAVGEILEGKRAKKTIERLNFQSPKPKEKLKIEDGGGDKLGDIPRTNYHIGKMKPADLKPLHTILFDRPGKMASMRKNMRLFNGFPFDVDSEPYVKKRERLLRTSFFTNSKLRVICKVLDLEKKGTQSDLIDKILTFLIAPKNSGKPLLSKKKKKSKKKLSGDDVMAKTKKKSKPKSSSSSSPKKTKTGSKSKAIVMDSSSDDDDDEEEEDDKTEAPAEVEEGSDTETKPSKKDKELSDEEAPKSKPARGKAASKKSAPVKRQRTPAKKTAPPKKRAKKEVSDPSESNSDSEADKKPKKKTAAKRAASAKPAAKTKKADSSSNSKKAASTVAEDSSDDDEPLIKMIKKAPSDEQLKETVQSLLQEANLEEMTMKQICQRVYDTYPDHDLTSRKDHIKQTVKSVSVPSGTGRADAMRRSQMV
ncbi:protein DEK [Diretmus argenteus]